MGMDFNQWVTHINNLVSRSQQMADGANAAARKALGAAQQSLEQAKQTAELLNSLKTGSGHECGRQDMLTIEQIPGRRIPFDVIVEIPIPESQGTPLPGSYPLPTDGPFVAVARGATFISTYTFQVPDQSGNPVRLTGRTWGRQRPISSVLDVMDAVAGWVDGVGLEMTGSCVADSGPMPAVISRPTSRSGGRSMVFDGHVKLNDDVMPRQNSGVPTSLWAPGWSQVLQLPVLDYWEKGTTIQFEVEPGHTNNPEAGNIQSLLGSMPFLAGQFDGHEGITYPAWQCLPGQDDTIQRRPTGVLVLTLFGYKILQPPGVRMRG